MLNIFSQDGSDRQLQHKIAYKVDKVGNSTQFKYYQVSDKELSKADWMERVTMEMCEFVIRTSAPLSFKIDDTVMIDGVRYMITYVQLQQREQNNGLFRKNMHPYVFLTLKR